MRTAEPVDFDLGGLVRIRVLDATDDDVAVVRRQLGPMAAAPEGPADLTIRFVDELARPAAMRILGLGDVAYTESDFLVSTTRTNGRFVQIPFADVGRPCEVVCERGVDAVPLLIALVNLTVLAKGVLALHASAFTFDGTGVLVTGWSKGGKTETLLAFMRQGADYVGDEWVYLTPNRMQGVPEPIRLWAWQLAQLPEYRASLSGSQRRRLTLFGVAAAAATAAGDRLRGSSGRTWRRAAAILERQRNVQVPPHRLFGDSRCVLEGNPDRVVLVSSHTSPEVTLDRVDPTHVAERMAFSLAEERSVLDAWYRRFRFAFPHAASPVIEDAPERERELLHRVLAGKDTFLLRHPYPPDVSTLFDALAGVL